VPLERDGDEDWHLHAVDVTTGRSRDVTPFAGVQARVLAMDPDVPGELLVGLNRDDPRLHDAYRLELASGRLELVERNPGFGWPQSWIADRRLRLRAGIRPRDDGGLDVVVRDDDAAPWRTVLSVDADEALTTGAVGFDAEGLHLHVITPAGADTARLLEVDAVSGAVRELASDPAVDVEHVRRHPVTREAQWVTLHRDRLRYLTVEPRWEPDLQALREMGAGDPYLVGNDDADAWWLVRLEAADRPARYVLYDRRRRCVRPLWSTRPALEGRLLAPVAPVALRARDGLRLQGYLTRPPEGSGPPYPTVLRVHGGPWDRDRWAFDPEVQWLANRGYACLQVNFRGSAGFGRRFLAAGDREWGARMQDDLLDAVAWAVREGHTDPARVGIYGSSYGGYAALMGAALAPETFRCAISMAGPTDLRTLIDHAPPYWAGLAGQFRRRVGDPRADADMLWERSPLRRADELRVPVLIAHGRNDPRVPVSEAEELVAALRRRGIAHEHLVFEDEGHGLTRRENRLRFARSAEAFLARHLGGRSEP
jgi:dipeptidyl aminopeptidase/acylaminoacyl peptidase